MTGAAPAGAAVTGAAATGGAGVPPAVTGVAATGGAGVPPAVTGVAGSTTVGRTGAAPARATGGGPGRFSRKSKRHTSQKRPSGSSRISPQEGQVEGDDGLPLSSAERGTGMGVPPGVSDRDSAAPPGEAGRMGAPQTEQ